MHRLHLCLLMAVLKDDVGESFSNGAGRGSHSECDIYTPQIDEAVDDFIPNLCPQFERPWSPGGDMSGREIY